MAATGSRARRAALWLGCALIACGDPGAASDAASAPDAPRDTAAEGKLQGEARTFPSKFVKGGIRVQPGVFEPVEAELSVFPFMSENRAVFDGKTVLEIGTGSGAISLYAAQLGARRVVSTDISEVALATARANAERLGFGSVIETRLVPPDDMSAYSVIRPDERFDVIISNPPYSLDLQAPVNTAVTDTGELGFSIVRGLDDHLTPDGVAILLYQTLFYHQVMVKFARHEGYAVRYHSPFQMTMWEAETLFNAYLARFLESQNLPPDAFRFDRTQDPELTKIRVAGEGAPPLFPGNSKRWFPGFIVIQRAKR